MKNLKNLHDFLDKIISDLKKLREKPNSINYYFLEAKTSFDHIEIFLN